MEVLGTPLGTLFTRIGAAAVVTGVTPSAWKSWNLTALQSQYIHRQSELLETRW